MTYGDMVITLGTSLLVLSLLNGVTAFVNETGFGGPGNTDGNDTLKGPLLLANQHPLNESRTNFPGFNLDTDPGSSDNATTPTTNWTMRAGLGLLDVASGRTGYPVSAATNTSTNLINLAFSLEFPREKLPSPNDTDWSLCAFSVLGDPWNQDILRKAIDDPGDCSNVLGASCFDALHRYLQQTMTPTTGIGCPSGIFLSTIDECKSFPAGTVGSSEVGLLNSSQTETDISSNTTRGLLSGQVFSFQSSETFDAAHAKAYYDHYATNLWMYILTFKPNQKFVKDHPGMSINAGATRTLCTVLNKDEARRENDAPNLDAYKTAGLLATLWTLILVWQMM